MIEHAGKKQVLARPTDFVAVHQMTLNDQGRRNRPDRPGHGLAKSIKVEGNRFRGLTINYRSGLTKISSGVPVFGLDKDFLSKSDLGHYVQCTF